MISDRQGLLEKSISSQRIDADCDGAAASTVVLALRADNGITIVKAPLNAIAIADLRQVIIPISCASRWLDGNVSNGFIGAKLS